jgi:imidazolonepropionase-like amidohydrolase
MKMERKIIAIKGGSLIDGSGKPPIKNAVVVIEGSMITRAGKEEEIKIPGAAEVIEANGKTIMPGMIDAHVHLASVVGVDPDAATAILRTPPALLVLHAAKHAREMLEAGFTTVRDVGGEMIHSEIFSLKRAIKLGLMPGPRIIAAGWVGMTAGHGDIMYNWEPTWPRKLNDPFCADGVWEIRKRIREFAREGADLIKTASSGERPYTPREYTKEELRALVDEAHALGMKVACHSTHAFGTKHAITAGVDTIEHGFGLDDEAIQMMIKSDVILVPTLSLTRPGQSLVVGRKTGEEERERAEKRRLENFRKAYQAGVKIAMGTDTFRILRDFWGQNAYEIELMVRGGMSEMEAIVATTRTCAEALGLDNQIGIIDKGKLADIIIVDGSPLDDIRTLQDNKKIHFVIKNGDIVVDRVNKGGELVL